MAIIGALPFNLQNGQVADATQVMADFNEIVTDTNANAATAGANSNITSLAGLTTPLSVSQGGSGSATPSPFPFAGGYRNLLRRNGGLEVWQRGAGGAASISVPAGSSTGLYTADGWYLANGANQGSAVSQAAPLTFGSQYSASILRSNLQTGIGVMTFGFPLDTDEFYPALGNYVRLSLVLKAGVSWSPAGGNIQVAVVVGTGVPVRAAVGYTGAALVINQTRAITTATTRYQFNSSAVVPVNTRQMEVYLQWTPVGTAGLVDGFNIDDVQLEVVPASSGYSSSDYERLNLQEQLMLCQRHYWKTFDYAVAPAQNAGTSGVFGFTQVVGAATTQFGVEIAHPVLMRVGPAVTSYNPSAANAEVRNTTAGSDWSAINISPDLRAIHFNAASAAGSVAGQAGAVQFQADAGI